MGLRGKFHIDRPLDPELFAFGGSEPHVEVKSAVPGWPGRPWQLQMDSLGQKAFAKVGGCLVGREVPTRHARITLTDIGVDHHHGQLAGDIDNLVIGVAWLNDHHDTFVARTVVLIDSAGEQTVERDAVDKVIFDRFFPGGLGYRVTFPCMGNRMIGAPGR